MNVNLYDVIQVIKDSKFLTEYYKVHLVAEIEATFESEEYLLKQAAKALEELLIESNPEAEAVYRKICQKVGVT